MARRATVGYGLLRDDGELEALARVQGAAFGMGTAVALPWLTANRAEARVWRTGGEMLGGLLRIPMGQYFAGRSVPTIGIAGVAIAPEARGTGAATRLMYEAMREMRRDGAVLSSLYPATYPLYRRAGYEIAGGRYKLRVPIRSLDAAARLPSVRKITDADGDPFRRCYRAFAQRRNGWLDRGEYIWERIFRVRDGKEVHAHVIESDSGIEGYVVHWQKSGDGLGYDQLMVRDMAATTPRALRRILSFLADHRSLTRDVVWYGGPDDPFLFTLPERTDVEVALSEHWMLRIVDVPGALAARGWPPDVEATLELSIEDELLPGNAACFRLDVRDGQAAVETLKRPGRGALRMHVRALAPLYTGHLGAEQLAVSGAITGPAAALARATALFATASPSLPDFF